MEIVNAQSRPIQLADLNPFFVGWGWVPSEQARISLIEGSSLIFGAWENDRLIGFASAMSDGGFFAYLSYLEVLPEYQGRGIARRLVLSVNEALDDHYDVATITDSELIPFYEKCGWRSDIVGVHLRLKK